MRDLVRHIRYVDRDGDGSYGDRDRRHWFGVRIFRGREPQGARAGVMP